MQTTYFYLSYGSNCNFEQMAKRCPGAIKVGNVKLTGSRLALRRSFFTIIRDENVETECAVWKITSENIESLDRYEGYPVFYDKKQVMLKMDDGKSIEALIYVMQPQYERDYTLPTRKYQRICRAGYADCQMDLKQLEDALEEVRALASRERVNEIIEKVSKDCGLCFERFPVDEPNFEAMGELRVTLRNILFNKKHCDLDILEALAYFQDTDGSFKLLDSWKVPYDVRVGECCAPTHLGAAIFMREYLRGYRSKYYDIESCLKRALNACVGCGLTGHGYDAESDLIYFLNIFVRGGLHDFLKIKPSICPEFNELVLKILSDRSTQLEKNGNITGEWGENYTSDWEKLLDEMIGDDENTCRKYGTYLKKIEKKLKYFKYARYFSNMLN